MTECKNCQCFSMCAERETDYLLTINTLKHMYRGQLNAIDWTVLLVLYIVASFPLLRNTV